MIVFPEFFDPTKEFGFCCDVRTQFPTAADLLRDLDRLGIARALAYHNEARAFHPGPGNRSLLREIESTPGAAGRLIPAAVVSPAMCFDKYALPQLKEAMKAERVRALRYFAGGNWNLMQIESVVAELLEYRPVIFFDGARGAPSYEEILQFAKRFPQLPLVMLQTMWPSEMRLADLMERCPNLHLDNSWMHSDLTLEFMVKRFGAQRVLFGGGPDSHNAAAVASLVHAEISDKEKTLIAGANLARLLELEDLPPTGITPLSSPRADKPLWNSYLRGEKLDVDIVDAHGHPTAPGVWLRENIEPDAMATRALKLMNRIGVDAMCMADMRALFGDNVASLDEHESRFSTFNNRFFGYVVFNPFQSERVLARLDDWFSRDYFVGFKLLNSYWGVPITDERFVPMWEYSQARRLPILMHTWIDAFNDPAMLADIAPAYPDATFILGHSGGSNHESAIKLALENPNVYLEWCGSFCSTQRWEEVIAKVGANRILYGSDAMAHSMDWELGRLLSLDLPDEKLIPILGANMRAILARRISA